MHTIRKTLAIVAIIGGLGTLNAFAANGQDKAQKAAPTVIVKCKEKTYPNISGENSFLLKKEKDGTFTAVTESYGKPKNYPQLNCRFHSKEGKVFFCEGGAERQWGAVGQRVKSLSVKVDGSETLFDGYLFEVVKNPLGELQTVFSVPFGVDKCSASR